MSKNIFYSLHDHVQGAPPLFLYASEKIVTINLRYTHRIIWQEKGSTLGFEKWATISLEYSDETLILKRKFFRNALKFSIGLMITLKVCTVNDVFIIVFCAGKWIMNVQHILQNIVTKTSIPLRGVTPSTQL